MAVDSLDTVVGAEVVDSVVDTVDVAAAVYVGVVLVVVDVVVVVHSVGVGLAVSAAASATVAVGIVLAAAMVVAVMMSAAVGAPAAKVLAAVRSASYPMGAGMPLVRRYLHLSATENPHCIWMMASEDVWIRRYCYPRIERIRRWLALLHHLMLAAY